MLTPQVVMRFNRGKWTELQGCKSSLRTTREDLLMRCSRYLRVHERRRVAIRPKADETIKTDNDNPRAGYHHADESCSLYAHKLGTQRWWF